MNYHPHNERIRAAKVILIDGSGRNWGEVAFSEALEKARETGLDLVQVSSGPVPVCRIMDYSKYLYAKEKKQKGSRSHTSVLKEVRFRPHTDEHDIEVKMKKIRKFLSDGDKVRITIFFKGREAIFVDEGRKMMDKIGSALSDVAKFEKSPLLMGRRLIAHLIRK